MNTNSKICNFISLNPSKWEQLLTDEYHIIIKKKGSLAIFNYNIGADFSDPIVKEARGIIINTSEQEVVCWPFNKFGNYTEYYADSIDWNTAKVQEKIDGSIIKMWYNNMTKHWEISTNGQIFASDAATPRGGNFLDAVRSAYNYKDIPFEYLDIDSTYLFELMSEDNRVVISSKRSELYHIGTRSNITGIERDENIGIIKPRLFPISSMNECLETIKHLNVSLIDDKVHSIIWEGFVVVDGNWNRVKVKTAEYNIIHHLLDGDNNINKINTINMIWSLKFDLYDICKDNKKIAHVIKYYDYKITEFVNTLDIFISLTWSLYLKCNNRKSIALLIKDHKYGWLCFIALDKGYHSAQEVLSSIPVSKWCNMIPSYVQQYVYDVFYPKS